MARDPPSLLASSELRDMSTDPSSVIDAKITIIHPQLRDLILPLERRRVLHPRGNTVEEVCWAIPEEQSDDEGEHRGESSAKGSRDNVIRNPFVKLNFTPNCLTGSRGMLAAGGQHGELHISHIPPMPEKRRAGEEVRPFRLDIMLDTKAINNAVVLLPEWPAGWAETSERRGIGYVGGQGRRESPGADPDREAEAEDEATWSGAGEQDAAAGEEDEEAMDLDDDEGDEDEVEEDSNDRPQPLSPATYPNTVPFRHPPRIPLPDPSSAATTRRASSFSQPPRPAPLPPTSSRIGRQSFSAQSTLHPIRVVSSNPSQPRVRTYSNSSTASISDLVPAHTTPGRPTSEHRILISSNDQTVRMLSLRRPHALSATATEWRPRSGSSYERESSVARLGQSEPTLRTHYRPAMAATAALFNQEWRTLQPVLPPSPMGSRFGWASLRTDYRSSDLGPDPQIAAHREQRARQIGYLEAAVGMNAGQTDTLPIRVPTTIRHTPLRLQPQAPWSQVRATAAERDLARRTSSVGGAILTFPVNHSSFSPDLKTMVSVGDSTNVQLFEVKDGGKDFKPIATYAAATDSSFSSAWSKDGRKFAVASQDGQVTVWDHRSSRPLATLFTDDSDSSSTGSRRGSPSFSEDISTRFDGWTQDRGMVLYNPLTGEPSTGASTSGREAARVVKFSPEGSSRDLMVFSEENSKIHIVDAKNFHDRVSIKVPSRLQAPSDPPVVISANYERPIRSGVEGGECGIAGVAFDPTGEWLYSGTERTLVEWDLRRVGGGEGGTWSMA